MFEPRPFSEKCSAQDNLIIALKNRDLAAFEEALADPDIDPDYWYGRPYWSTCLQLAAKTDGCEAFVLALLRAGAGSPRGQRGSAHSAAKRPSVDGGDGRVNGAGAFGDHPHLCVCGAQGVSAMAVAATSNGQTAVDVASMEAAAGAAGTSGASGHRSSTSRSPVQQQQSPETNDQQTMRFWLRDLGRAVREMSDCVGDELRALCERMEQLEERVAAMERAQQKTNELLRHGKVHR